MANKQKNTKALISLILAAGAVVCLVLACIPMQELRILGKGTGIMLSGGINVLFAFIAFPIAIAALVFGILAKRKAPDKKATIGKVFGILCIIGSLFIGFCVSAISLLNDYANDPVNSTLGKSIRDDESRKQLDDLVKQMARLKDFHKESSASSTDIAAD